MTPEMAELLKELEERYEEFSKKIDKAHREALRLVDMRAEVFLLIRKIRDREEKQ
jgi:hypothetical protein